MTTLPGLCTREDVANALDVAPSVRAHRQLDRWVQAARVSVEQLCHRSSFHPVVATKSFAWPTRDRRTSWRLWLDEHPLISITTLSTGGRTIDAADYLLEPQDSGPPYTRIELDLGSSSAGGWGGGDTPQRSITVAGVWGWSTDTEPAGAIAAGAGINASVTQVQVTDGAAVGVGDLIEIESERLVITERTWVTSTQTLQAALTALQSATSVSVTSGAGFTVGEQLLIDSEIVSVDAIAGNTLTVTRAIVGTTLAAHSGSTIYVSRLLTVTRGAVGTTAAAHSAGVAVSRWMPPPLLNDLAVAEVLVGTQREQSGMARTIGSGEGVRAAPGGDIKDLRDRVKARYGRKARTRAV